MKASPASGRRDGVGVSGTAEDSAATGVNGNQADSSASEAGAAYVFDIGLVPGPWTDLGSGLAGVSGIPNLVGTGTLAAGSAGTLVLSNAAPSALSILFVSLASTPSPFKCGALVPVPSVAEFLIPIGAGTIPLAWSAWPAGLSGASLYFRYAIQDAAAVGGVALSNALRADVP